LPSNPKGEPNHPRDPNIVEAPWEIIKNPGKKFGSFERKGTLIVPGEMEKCPLVLGFLWPPKNPLCCSWPPGN